MVWGITIAEYLNTKLYGLNINILRPCSINNICPAGLVFAKSYLDENLYLLNNDNDYMAIVCPEYIGKLNCSYVISDNPRLDFARVLQEFFTPKAIPGVADTARIGSNVSLGSGVSIGEYSVIGNNVVIGGNTEIRHHVVIGDNTVIGSDCLIKTNTVIGEEGFGFERDEMGVPIRIPHLGKVIIGDNVEIGASTVIARGTIDDTIIENNVKIDDQVFIAHNVFVGRNSMIIAETEISGSAHIGEMTWLGPNCSIMNGINIGANVLVGLGAVVNKSIENNTIIAGNPARVLRKKN